MVEGVTCVATNAVLRLGRAVAAAATDTGTGARFRLGGFSVPGLGRGRRAR